VQGWHKNKIPARAAWLIGEKPCLSKPADWCNCIILTGKFHLPEVLSALQKNQSPFIKVEYTPCRRGASDAGKLLRLRDIAGGGALLSNATHG